MKKVLLIGFIIFCIFQMMVLATDIDIGSPAIDRATEWGTNLTLIVRDNPANASGIITSVEIYAYTGYDLTNCEVATFYRPDPDGFPNNFSTRDTEAIGTVTGGSKQTFGVNLDVQTGDYIGIYYSGGYIEKDATGYDGIWNSSGNDYIPCTNQSFGTHVANVTVSLCGTGTTEVGWSHKWNTVTIGKWNTKEIIKWNDLE